MALNNPVKLLVIESIVLRGYAESKTINAPVSILLQRASPCVVETAPKAQAKTTWWHGNLLGHHVSNTFSTLLMFSRMIHVSGTFIIQGIHLCVSSI